MSQSLARNLIHLVYSTKNRHPWIIEDVREGLYKYQAGIFKDCESQSILIGGVADHVHALFALSKNWSLASVVEEVKIRNPGRRYALPWAILPGPFEACWLVRLSLR